MNMIVVNYRTKDPESLFFVGMPIGNFDHLV